MRTPCTLLATLLLAGSALGQSVQSVSGRNSQPGTDSRLAAAAPEVRRAQPVTRSAKAVPAPPTSPGGNAVLRTGDSFELRMTGMPVEDASMYSLTFTVSSDGMVNIPLGGQIRAAGLTLSQLETAIERRLIDEKIFTGPTATINVPNQARFVTVGGNVRAPNRQPWSPDLTLLVAIAASGGANEWGGDKIDLIRGGQIQTFSLKKLNKNPSDDPKLVPGDRLDMR